MIPVNLFLTERGVLKMGYYGLTTQAECYSIKKMECDGLRSFAPEVFKGKYGMKSDVWSFGIALLVIMGITPYFRNNKHDLPTIKGRDKSPFYAYDVESEELFDFLCYCFEEKEEGWSVKELMNVSGIGWRMMSSIHL